MASQHTVAKGDSLLGITYRSGFRTLETILAHPPNQALRARRTGSNVLREGEIVHIPDPTPKNVPCETNQKHVFRLKRLVAELRLLLRDELGEPHANVRFHLEVAGQKHDGETDEDGVLVVSVPPDATEGKLKLWLHPNDPEPSETWTLQIGHREPEDSIRGMKARLNALGFDAGAIDDALDDKAREALRGFQEMIGVEETGEPDPETLHALARLHGDDNP